MQTDQSSQTERERLCLRNELANMHYCDAFLIKSSALLDDCSQYVCRIFAVTVQLYHSPASPSMYSKLSMHNPSLFCPRILYSIAYDKSYQQLGVQCLQEICHN